MKVKMILLDRDIVEARERGDIIIEPFDGEHLGPNSYDVTLASHLMVYDYAQAGELDMDRTNSVRQITIPETGLRLEPGQLYLGATNEIIGSKRHFVPHLEGRSSIGRLGMGVHVTAGFGDLGYVGRWTLEITVVHPLRIYPNRRVAQSYFLLGMGLRADRPYSGRYADAAQIVEPIPSRFHLDKTEAEK
jgi:dCTP deaminase